MSEVINMHIAETIQTGGGGGSNEIWLPNVSEQGVISWTKSTSTTAPTERNIKGADGADGQDGADGRGIKSVAVDASNHLVVTYDDDTPEDAGEINVTVPIDDTTAASDKVYSSSKVEALVNGDLPSFYETEFATTKASVESHSTVDSYNIMFMTDLHFSSKGSGYNEDTLRAPLFRTMRASKKFVAQVPISQFVLGGDYEQFQSDCTKEMGISNIAELNEMFDSVQSAFLPISGNHEKVYTGGASGAGLTNDEVYQYLLKKWVGRNGIKKASINLFYRIDDENHVCHVFVSAFWNTDARDAILADFSTIVTANTNDYPYIIYCHYGSTSDGIESGVQTSIDYIKTTLGKTIIAWISGHWHADGAYVYNDTLVVSLLNSCYGGNMQGQDGQIYNKTKQTATESAFSVLTFVPTTGKLFVTRFGAGVDFECNYNTTSGAIGRIGYLPFHNVTNTLSGGVKTNNSSATAADSEPYTATLNVPDNHFTIGTVTITMGGTDITSSAYDSSTHVISVASVTDDIVITATATNDYLFTVADSTIEQFLNANKCTYSTEANDIDIDITLQNSGLRIKQPIKAAIPTTGHATINIQCDAAEAIHPTSDNDFYQFLFSFKYGNNQTVKSVGFESSLTTTWDNLVTGVTSSFDLSSSYSDVTYLEILIRVLGGEQHEGKLPLNISLSNLRATMTIT